MGASQAEVDFMAAWDEYGFSGSKSQLLHEHRFHPTRRWRFDFAFDCLQPKVAIEIEGRGRHQTFSGYKKDCEKYNEAARLGWVVLRLVASDVTADPVGQVEYVKELISGITEIRQ